jgi:hypothetical protein
LYLHLHLYQSTIYRKAEKCYFRVRNRNLSRNDRVLFCAINLLLLLPQNVTIKLIRQKTRDNQQLRNCQLTELKWQKKSVFAKDWQFQTKAITILNRHNFNFYICLLLEWLEARFKVLSFLPPIFIWQEKSTWHCCMFCNPANVWTVGCLTKFSFFVVYFESISCHLTKTRAPKKTKTPDKSIFVSIKTSLEIIS